MIFYNDIHRSESQTNQREQRHKSKSERVESSQNANTNDVDASECEPSAGLISERASYLHLRFLPSRWPFREFSCKSWARRVKVEAIERAQATQVTEKNWSPRLGDDWQTSTVNCRTPHTALSAGSAHVRLGRFDARLQYIIYSINVLMRLYIKAKIF